MNITVKPVLSSHSKIDKTKVLMTDYCLMQVKSIAECLSLNAVQSTAESYRLILQNAPSNTFDLH